MVQPKMVYISQSTEYGSVYSLDELKDIATLCKKKELYLFVDGARLGSAFQLVLQYYLRYKNHVI